MDFLKWYKNIVEKAEPEPPAEVWEVIQNELDIAEVWGKIENELDITEVWNKLEKDLPAKGNSRRRIAFIMAAAASISLIIGTAILFRQGPSYFNHHLADSAREIVIPGRLTDPVSSIQPLQIARLEFPAARGTVSGPAPAEEAAPVTGTVYRKEEQFYMPAGLKPRLDHGHDIQLEIIASAPDRPADAGYSTTIGNFAGSGYYGGLAGHLANTWLVNNKTRQGLRSDDLTASLPSFGYSFGIIAGKSITRKIDLQADIFILSLSTQSYNEYMHGQYINNKMRLNYSSFALSGRWYLFNKNAVRNHSLLLGAYTGILKNAVQDLNGESVSINDDYRSGDYGIIAGYEYLHSIGNNFSIGAGIQSRIGLNNIFAGTDIIPAYLNNTRNASLNLQFSARYNLN